MKWIKPQIEEEKSVPFKNTTEAIVSGSGAAEDIFLGHGQLAKDATKTFCHALAFLKRANRLYKELHHIV